jgi:hypothetical protein
MYHIVNKIDHMISLTIGTFLDKNTAVVTRGQSISISTRISTGYFIAGLKKPAGPALRLDPLLELALGLGAGFFILHCG